MAQKEIVQQKAQAKNKPEQVFRFGGINASVWKNTYEGDNNKEFTVRSVTLQRSYKDKEGNWQHTGSLRQADLAKAIVALEKAQEFCWTADTTDVKADASAEEGE